LIQQQQLDDGEPEEMTYSYAEGKKGTVSSVH